MGIFEGHIRVHEGDRFALVASRWTAPVPEQVRQGLAITLPSPRQRGQVVWTTKKPCRWTT